MMNRLGTYMAPITVSLGVVLVFGLIPMADALGAAGTADVIAVVRRSAHTGHATFVRAAGPSGTMPVTPSAGRTGVRADDFLQQHGHLFGVTDAPRQMVLDPTRTATDLFGFTHTTFTQVHRGVPVFSGILKVHQNRAGGIHAANGDFYSIPDKLNVIPTIDSARAAELARAEIKSAQAAVAYRELVIVDPAWYGDAPQGARLAYHLILTDEAAPLREALFVDAHSGVALDRWNLLHTAQDRRVFNANGGPSLPGTLARIEGQGPNSSFEVNLAYDYSGDFYGYLQRGFQRDSIDDDGLMLISSVDFDEPTFCPNAQWNGEQTIYCIGAASDDVVGHEFAHGLTQYTANLIYQNQSGMLNESFSDVFGELIDLFNGNAAFVGPPAASGWPIPSGYVGGGLDTPNGLRSSMSDVCDDGTRWLAAEDASGAFGGAIRDMWNPPCFNDPSTLNSVLMICPASDNGGVHRGSGVGNHAFAILVDGKAFNGQTVSGIGPIKAGAVWYRALTTYLTITSDYADAYDAFNQAAADLVGLTPLDPRTGLATGTPFSASDAQQVNMALLAVEMNTDGSCGKSVDVLDSSPPPHCAPRFAISSFDFENGAPGWTVNHFGPTGPPTPYNWVLRGNLPFQRTGQAWFCADPSIGDCGPNDESAVHQLFSPTINLPITLGNPFLSFTHYLASEPSYDGGNVKLSVNGGPFQVIPANRFTFNAYNATLETTGGGNTNPLAGEPAWTGAGGRWGTSLVDLFALVQGGDSIRLLFDFGKDGCTGIDGWYVDDVEIYDCMCVSNAQCDDGMFCTGVETCVNSLCQSTGNPCTDFCVESGDACVAAAFFDTFENGNTNGWQLQGDGATALAGHWVIGNPNGTIVNGTPAQPEDAFQGAGCAFTGQNSTADVDDVDGGVAALVSPPIDLSRNNHAEFSYVRWFFLRDLAPGSADFFAVDISDNDGASWFTLEQLNNNQPAAAWTTVSWTLEDFILLSAQVRVRFRVGDGVSAVNIVEGAVDDILIAVSGECNDPGDCDDADPCTADSCQLNGTCTHQPLSCLAITGSDPPSGAVDARQPHDISSALLPLGVVKAALTFSGGSVAALTSDDFTLEKQGGALPPPVLIDVSPLAADTVQLTWSDPLESASWLKITHNDSQSSVCFGALPGDVNSDDLTATGDVSVLRAVLTALPGNAALPLHTDIDHSGTTNASDLTRLLDVLNGAGAFDPWLDQSSPPMPCP